ncbi:uncharacterized protein [Amphiura filiformis]|uniref:uncharacterized protein n=1 Tax=Amphiura filiformis TaxID=82378 RepID=UPI003B20DC02
MAVDLNGAKQTLQDALIVLTDNLSPASLLRKMKGKNALTSDEVTRINTGVTDTERVEKLIETLKRKPLISYHAFMELLSQERHDLYEEVIKIEATHTAGIPGNTKPSTHAQGSLGQESGMEQVSDKDISKVTSKVGLTRDQFKKMYRELGITACNIENAERTADTNDVQLQAAKVLEDWRSANGKDASRRAIIGALKECGFNNAVEKLSTVWGLSA